MKIVKGIQLKIAVSCFRNAINYSAGLHVCRCAYLVVLDHRHSVNDRRLLRLQEKLYRINIINSYSIYILNNVNKWLSFNTISLNIFVF